MNWYIGIIAIVMLVIGLVGQGFELRKIRVATLRDEDLASPKIFMNKRNLKWYIIIGVAIILWYIAERMQ